MDRDTVKCSIKDFTLRGFGLGAIEGGKPSIEVAHALPGDCVRVELMRQRHKIKKGRLLELLEPSTDRIEPRCSHARLCGGCCWQAMKYEAQLAHKQKRILSAFGDLINETVDVHSMIPCLDPWRYRNKMEFSFSENRAGTRYLGLMIAHAEPFVFNVEACHIAPSWMSECLERVRAWWIDSGLTAYYPPQDRGTLRYLTLRQAVRTGEKMAVLNVSGNPKFAPSKEQVERFAALFDDETGVFLRVHQTLKGTPTRFYEMHLKGPDHIVEEMRLQHKTLRFKISPASFFQPNTLQAEVLYDAVISLLGADHLVVYDLYCGTGTLGMAAAAAAREVIGIELSAEAVLDAQENAAKNGISNIRLIQGDVGRVLTKLLGEPGFCRPDAVIVDPPRAGLDELALHHLRLLSPKTIVYVSCNPITQAENIRFFKEAGYVLKTLLGVDQFPHTAHIESIALLKK